MPRGPQPTPVELKQLRGNPGKRKMEEPIPFDRSIPDRPSWLFGEASDEWDRAIAQLRGVPGLLAKIDRAMLASYCEAWAEYVESCEELRKVGRYYTSSNGNPLRHPLCQIRDNAADRCMRLADRFGMSPSARTRLARVEEEATDDFADAFGA